MLEHWALTKFFLHKKKDKRYTKIDSSEALVFRKVFRHLFHCFWVNAVALSSIYESDIKKKGKIRGMQTLRSKLERGLFEIALAIATADAPTKFICS